MKEINGTLHTNTGRLAEGSLVKYSCHSGYERVMGNLVQECVQNATQYYWTGKAPVCDRKFRFDISTYLPTYLPTY